MVRSRGASCRKQIAEQEQVPVFTIFTNEHLAAIAQQRPASATAPQGIAGIGDGKVTRYGERVLAVVGKRRWAAAMARLWRGSAGGELDEAAFARRAGSMVAHARSAASMRRAAAPCRCGEQTENLRFVTTDERLAEAARRDGFAVRVIAG